MTQELIERLRAICDPNGLADEAADALQSQSARIAELEGENKQLQIDRLTILAMVYSVAPLAVAKMCDEQLDRSGALLGEVREISRRAALNKDSTSG